MFLQLCDTLVYKLQAENIYDCKLNVLLIFKIKIWLDLAEKLKNKSGSDDVAEICIPQVHVFLLINFVNAKS